MNTCSNPTTFSWKLTFSEFNFLNIHVLYINAPTLADCLVTLHEYLKPEFIASHLLSVEFNSVVHE